MRKTAAFVAIASLLAVGMSFLPQGASAQIPEINLDLTIDPDQGPPGTVINTFVPPEQAQEVCMDNTAFGAALALIAQTFLTQEPPGEPQLQGFFTVLAGALQSGAIFANPEDVAFLYVLAFADIATQQPVEGSDNPFWDPFTGEGQITAPEAPFGTYAIAAVCLGPRPFEDIDFAGMLEAMLAAGFNPQDPQTTFQSGLEAAIPFLIDTDNPLGTGFQLYCLGDDAFCNPPPEGPVAAEPVFTG